MSNEPAAMTTNWHDLLSNLGRQVLALRPRDAYYELVVPTGDGPREIVQALRRVRPAALFANPPTDANEAAATLAGLWLWHDGLDPSHEISQKINTPTGSCWHAILHRREGDFANSKYWYDRAAGHAALGAMATRAATLLGGEPGVLAPVQKGGWNPHAFVDLVEQAQRDTSGLPLPAIVALQRLEWETLFEHTVRNAASK